MTANGSVPRQRRMISTSAFRWDMGVALQRRD
jgi:hypothetical protein